MKPWVYRLYCEGKKVAEYRFPKAASTHWARLEGKCELVMYNKWTKEKNVIARKGE